MNKCIDLTNKIKKLLESNLGPDTEHVIAIQDGQSQHHRQLAKFSGDAKGFERAKKKLQDVHAGLGHANYMIHKVSKNHVTGAKTITSSFEQESGNTFHRTNKFVGHNVFH